MSKLAIVCIGYNRPEPLKRLLDSLAKSDYGLDKPDLIISIDHSKDLSCKEVADQFVWDYGNKIVNFQTESLGLKKHILSVGKWLDIYDSIVVLEDDLVVSPAFYNYSKQAVKAYKDNPAIAGISLYAINFNQTAGYPFVPERLGNDAYFIQYAQSWGQIWMRESWKEFEKWLSKNINLNFSSFPEIPNNVQNWSEKSWLKHHIAYCILENKYFVYPYDSLSTCFSEKGEHSIIKEHAMQAPLYMDTKHKYSFPEYRDTENDDSKKQSDQNAVIYDAFFERRLTNQEFGFSALKKYNRLAFDLYGQKNEKAVKSKYNYMLSSQILNYKIEETFGREMKPHEANVFYRVSGEDFYLYNLNQAAANVSHPNSENSFSYYHQILGHTNIILKYLLKKVLQEFRLRITKN